GDEATAARITDAIETSSIASKGSVLGGRMRRYSIERKRTEADAAGAEASAFFRTVTLNSSTAGTLAGRADFSIPLLLEDDAAVLLYGYGRRRIGFTGIYASWLPALALRVKGIDESERVALEFLAYARR